MYCMLKSQIDVSVPIRGLFNLTRGGGVITATSEKGVFPSPSGDYLI